MYNMWFTVHLDRDRLQTMEKQSVDRVPEITNSKEEAGTARYNPSYKNKYNLMRQ